LGKIPPLYSPHYAYFPHKELRLEGILNFILAESRRFKQLMTNIKKQTSTTVQYEGVCAHPNTQ
jgi:hypothetical protein